MRFMKTNLILQNNVHLVSLCCHTMPEMMSKHVEQILCNTLHMPYLLIKPNKVLIYLKFNDDAHTQIYQM